jgi:hypothetical protein
MKAVVHDPYAPEWLSVTAFLAGADDHVVGVSAGQWK